MDTPIYILAILMMIGLVIVITGAEGQFGVLLACVFCPDSVVIGA